MANDVNKPKGRRRGDTSNLGQVFRKIAQAAKPGVEETRLEAIQEALQARMEDLHERIEAVQQDSDEADELLKEIAAIGAPLGTVQSKLEGFQAGRRTAVQKVTQQQIGRFASERASGRRVRAIGQQPGVYGQASTLSTQVTGSVLQQKHEHEINRADMLRQTLIERAASGAPQEELERVAGMMTRYEQRGAVTANALAAQRRRGESTQQLHEQGLKLTSAVQQERRHREIQEEAIASVNRGDARHITQGGFSGTYGERQEALVKATDNLIKTFKDFNDALEDGSDSVGEAEKAYKAAQQTFRERQIAASAGPGGGEGGLLEGIVKFFSGKAAAPLMIGGEIFKQTGALTRMFGVELPNRRGEVQTGFAQVANMQYKDVRAAGEQFNFAAARRLGGFYAAMEASGEEVARAESAALAQEGLGQLAQDTVGAAQKLAATDVSGAGINAAQGVGRFTRTAALFGTGIQAGERKLANIMVNRRLGDAANLQRDTNVQSFIDFTLSTGLATRGLGGRRDAALTTMLSEGGLNQLAQVGIKSSQIAALTQTGVNAMGAEFTGVETLQRAGIAQKAGIMTAEQFITQAGSLSTMGGGSDQLEKIMRQAVSSGMDNSKNVQQMVSATIALSADLAAAGQDVTGGQADILAAQTQTLSDMAVNQRAAVAQRASAVMNEAGGDREMNIFTVQRAAATRRMLEGRNVSFAGFEAALTTQPNILRSIRGAVQEGDSERAITLARRAGLGQVLVNKSGGFDEDMLKNMESISRNDQINRLMSFGKVNSKVEKDIRTKLNDPKNQGKNLEDIWDSLSQDSRDEIEALGQTHRAGRVSGKSMFMGSVAISDAKVKEDNYNTKGEGTADEVERAQQIQAQSMINPITTGMKELGDTFKRALKETNDIFKEMPKANLKQMQDDATEAAEKFDVPIRNFNAGVDKFSDAVTSFDSLINKFNIIKPDNLKEAMQKQAGSSGNVQKKSGG